MIEREQIEDWLRRFRVHDLEVVTEPAEAFRWHLKFKYPGAEGRTFSVVSPVHDEDEVQVQSTTNVVDHHREALQALTDEAFRSFYVTLIRDILTAGRSTYALEASPQERDLRKFVLISRLWSDSLTRQKLYQGIQDVFDMSLLAVVHVRHAVGEGL